MELVNETFLNNGLTSIGNKIREKNGTASLLAFPAGISMAIDGFLKESIHYANLLYAVNCRGETIKLGDLQTGWLEQQYANKTIIQLIVDFTVLEIKTIAGVSKVYFVNDLGTITEPADSTHIAENNYFYLIGDSATDSTVCYFATSIDAYYTAIRNLILL